MKRTVICLNNIKTNSLDRNRRGGTFRDAIVRTKTLLLNEYVELAGEHARVLRLALNEAEALAWQTEYPQLFFPALAMEKAEAALRWHRRQRAIRRADGEVALAE